MSRAAAGLAVLFTAALTTITTETLPMGLLPQMSRGLGVTESWTGLLVGGYSLLIVATAIPLTTLTSRWDRRRLLLTVMGLFTISNALLAAAPNYQVALLARLIAALGHGVLWSAMAGYATGLVDPVKAGRAVAVVFAGNSAALTAGVPLGTLLGQAAGWRTAFAVLSGVSALLVLAGRAVLPRHEGTSTPTGTRQALRIPGVRLVAAATALVMLGHFTLHTYLVPYLGSAVAASALFVFGLAGIVGVAAAGLLADRRTSPALLSTLGLLATALAVLPVTGGPTTIAVIAMWGLAYAALPTLLQTLALKRAPRAGSAASALFIIAFNVGITAGSLAGGQTLAFLGAAWLPAVAVIPVLSALVAMSLGARREARSYAAVGT
ncbi:MFS transporter [Nonomuraea jabiensis]|uniref:MFS transporter n=1 Tax=Nonomuraea jabiensis TaxID=882448 RepID=UPI00367CFF0A